MQTNVESYVAMYTDELEKYFDKLKASPAAKNFQDMVAKDRTPRPRGPGGWGKSGVTLTTRTAAISSSPPCWKT